MRGDQHHFVFRKPESLPRGLPDLAVQRAREDMDVCAHQNAAMLLPILECQHPRPEFGSDAFRRPVPMPVSANPPQLLRRDLRFCRSRPELLRSSGLDQTQPNEEDSEARSLHPRPPRSAIAAR